MPYVLILIALLAIASAVKGTYAELGAEIVTDFKGSAGVPGYIYWVSSIVAVGAIGYYSPLQKFSRAFLVLILLGMVLANQGLFARLQSALQNPVEPSQPPAGTTTNASTQSTNSQQSSLNNGAQMLSEATTAIDLASIALV